LNEGVQVVEIVTDAHSQIATTMSKFFSSSKSISNLKKSF